MNPHDLTAFFEFVDANHAKHPEGDPMRVAVPGGWEYDEDDDVWVRSHEDCFYDYGPKNAQTIDHQAACHCMSEWLAYQNYAVRRATDGVGWFYCCTLNGSSRSAMYLDCPDDPLAARLAAAKEIER